MDTLAAPSGNANPAQIIAQIKAKQNFPFAIGAGLCAAVAGAFLWAIVTVLTRSELGLMAIAVGYLVGWAIKVSGKGIEPKFGYLGAACGLLGCVLGNIFSDIAFYAQVSHVEITQVIGMVTPDFLPRLIRAYYQPMDILFYGIAVYEGYKFSFKYRLRKNPPAAKTP